MELATALISFPGASGMTSGFGSLPGVMCVLLDLFTSWLGPKRLHREGNHMFIRFVFWAFVLLLARGVPGMCLTFCFLPGFLETSPSSVDAYLVAFRPSPRLGFCKVPGVPGSPAELGLCPLLRPCVCTLTYPGTMAPQLCWPPD